MRTKGSKNKKKMDAKRVLFYAQQEDIELLENLGHGNKSLGLRNVVSAYNILMSYLDVSAKMNVLTWEKIEKIFKKGSK